jgi:hypothetical protein
MSVITLEFAGYAQCRLATDPDPTDERRGVSGYTFAMPGEPDLDWTIYTQPGAGVVERVGVTDRKVGVVVTGGYCGVEKIEGDHPLMGATINLEDKPRFEERNYIVVNKTFGVISPFKLRVKGKGIELFRQVHYYPGQPITTPITEVPQEILMPYTSDFQGNVAACVALMPGGNPSVYRQQRLDALLGIRARSRYAKDSPALAALNKRIEQLRMDNPSDRRTGQLVNATFFGFGINGPAAVKFGKAEKWLNGTLGKGGWQYLDPSRPLPSWPVSFMMGSWDADSLTFYMSGTLQAWGFDAELEQWMAERKKTVK